MPSRLDARCGWPSVYGDSTELKICGWTVLWLQAGEAENSLKQDVRLEVDSGWRALGEKLDTRTTSGDTEYGSLVCGVDLRPGQDQDDPIVI